MISSHAHSTTQFVSDHLEQKAAPKIKPVDVDKIETQLRRENGGHKSNIILRREVTKHHKRRWSEQFHVERDVVRRLSFHNFFVAFGSFEFVPNCGCYRTRN